MPSSDDVLEVEEFLAHYGVKGMKWGVRRYQDKDGRRIGAKKQSSSESKPKRGSTSSEAAQGKVKDEKVQAAVGMDASDSERMKAKYGPGSMDEKPRFTLSPRAKKLLIAGAIAAVAVGGAYAWKSASDKAYAEKVFRELHGYGEFMAESNKLKRDSIVKGFTRDQIAKLGTTPVNLDAGSIFSRVSTEQEASIRDSGFFAVFEPADLNRYKAVLPSYWSEWGMKQSEGFVVNLKAKTSIKAPSERETFELFKGFISSSNPKSELLKASLDAMDPFTAGLRRARYPQTDEDWARLYFPLFAASWTDIGPGSISEDFINLVKSKGYNALIDMNDAGTIGEKPMRILDGSLFDVDGYDKLSAADIDQARKTIESIFHFMMTLGGIMDTLYGDIDDETEEFLAHYGVKGMKWGVRRYQDKDGRRINAPRKTVRAAKKDAKEYTKAKMFYGEGAGTRRKLIKTKTEARSRRDPMYKKIFEDAVAQTDMAQRASQAAGERRRADAKIKSKRGARQVGHAIRGNTQHSSILALATVAGATYYYNNGGKEQMTKWGNQALDIAMNGQAKNWGKNWMKQNGLWN